jgi:hypothetical protein
MGNEAAATTRKLGATKDGPVPEAASVQRGDWAAQMGVGDSPPSAVYPGPALATRCFAWRTRPCSAAWPQPPCTPLNKTARQNHTTSRGSSPPA